MNARTALLASLFLASAASAAVETHSVDYTYSLADDGDNLPRLNFAGFDTLGGQHVLERVEVRVQAKIAGTIGIENMTAADLDNWTIEAEHTVLAAFERTATGEFGPFAFLGGLSIEPFGTVLSSADGVAGSGRDFFAVGDSTNVDSILEMDSSYLEFFTGGGDVTAMVGPFAEFTLDGASQWNEFDGGDAIVNFTDLAKNGTMSVIYTYSVVPEPTGMLALAGVGAMVRRRR